MAVLSRYHIATLALALLFSISAMSFAAQGSPQRHAKGERPANVNHLLILSNPLYALTMARAFRWLSCVAALKGLRSSSPQR